jgi:hypothetical protein
LFLNPAEEGLQLFGQAEGREAVEALVEFLVGIGGVKLLVAGFAEGRAVLGLAAALLGLEVVERNEVGGNPPLAERAGLPVCGRRKRRHSRGDQR